MIRLFVQNKLSLNTSFSPSEKQQHYLIHVMRQKAGDSVLCFNGRDGEWLCRIKQLGKRQIELLVEDQTQIQTTREFCALCPAIIKKDPMDLVLQKATELGVSDIYPLITDHTVVKNFNMDRARAIIEEAAEQSERLDVPTLHNPVCVTDLNQNLPKECACCYLSEREYNLPQKELKNPIAFLVGPEGGWSKEEVAFFKKHPKFSGVHFVGGILRAETAAITALSCWQIGRFIKWKK